MEPTRVDVGDVYRWPHDDRPIRVLVSDGDVVMYDAWWPHLEAWGLANLQEIRRLRISYYVSTVSPLLEKATFLRAEPLTDDEIALHRPDLPFCLDAHANQNADVDVDATVAAAEIVLHPYGPRGGQKAGVRVKADDGIAFTAGELRRKAVAVQAASIGATSRSGVDEVAAIQRIGIYRSGLQRGVPSYYLWSGESRLHAQIATADRERATDGGAS